MNTTSPSQTDTLINVLHEAEGSWVSLPELVSRGCGYAVATRVSNARKMGCRIENKIEYSQISGMKHSFYRMLPPT